MKVKYTQKFLEMLENTFQNMEYQVRYEKGNFQAGYCLLSGQKIIIINKYFTLEGRINALIEILKKVDIPESILADDKNEWLRNFEVPS
jgi:hypothetical protein